MARPKKITWKVVYDDFKSVYPKQAERALWFEPHNFATIKIKFIDNTYMTYNYDTKELTKI